MYWRPNPLVFQTKKEIIDIFKKLRIEDKYFLVSQNARYGKIACFKASVFTVYPSNINIFYNSQINMFEETIGILKKNMLDCINPIYWIENLIFLPQNILICLGIDSASIIGKLFNVIVWIVIFVLGLFDNEVKTFIISHFIK